MTLGLGCAAQGGPFGKRVMAVAHAPLLAAKHSEIWEYGPSTSKVQAQVPQNDRVRFWPCRDLHGHVWHRLCKVYAAYKHLEQAAFVRSQDPSHSVGSQTGFGNFVMIIRPCSTGYLHIPRYAVLLVSTAYLHFPCGWPPASGHPQAGSVVLFV